MRRTIELLGKRFRVRVDGRPGAHTFSLDGERGEPARLERLEEDTLSLTLGEDTCRMNIVQTGEDVFIKTTEGDFHLRILDPVEQAAQEGGKRGDTAKAPMPGVVIETFVKPGDLVAAGSPIMTIESMKIITVIKAPRDGEIEAVHFPRGTAFEKDAVLVSLKAGGAP
jgi:3-methylcrotonyl-CoA carboxylase alpha subunit